MPDEHIPYEVERGRARITLNRPEKRNALSRRCSPSSSRRSGTRTRTSGCTRDPARRRPGLLRGLRPHLRSGAPATTACPGAARARSTTTSAARAPQPPHPRALRHAQAVLAQVHGHCLAGGTDLALACDMVIAADDARFGFPPARNLGALPEQPVALQLRAAVGEAPPADRRHDHGRRSGADRARAEGRAARRCSRPRSRASPTASR